MEFTTKINASFASGISGFLGINGMVDIDTTTYATVKWSVDIECREWGIKSISAIPISVTGEIEWEVYSDELNEEDIVQVKAAGGYEMRNNKWHGTTKIPSDYELVNDIHMDGDTLQISEVEINFDEKKIYIN